MSKMETEIVMTQAFSIQQFDRTVLGKWKIRMLSYFRKRNWLDLLSDLKKSKRKEGDEEETGGSKEDRRDPDASESEEEAMDFILSKISDKYMYLVSNKKTAKDIWEAVLNV